MQLEEGKTYLTRQGDEVTVRNKKEGIFFPWISDSGEKSFTNSGNYFTDGGKSVHDIVSEVITAPAKLARIPHVHAEVIKAWADGAQIEHQNTRAGGWHLADSPAWNPDTKYRVKPEPVPNVVTWCAVITNGELCYGNQDLSTAQRPYQTGLLRIEINNTDSANPVLVSATLEKP